MNRSLKILLLFLLVLGAVGAAFYAGRQTAPPAAGAAAAKIKYHCPMHPTYISDRPGDCPICGMSLVKIDEAKAPGAHAGQATQAPQVAGRAGVFLSPDRQQLIGLSSSLVEKHRLTRSIRTVARVTYAEPHLAWVNTKFAGWIEKLHVNATGQAVRKGEPLLDIYSPELVSAQEEYLLAARANNSPLLEAARRRLQLWDINDPQIAQLEKSGKPRKTLTIFAPLDGYVIEKTALEGKAVMSGENLFRIAGLSTVWLMADIYENELPLVKLGQPAEVTLTYLPGEKFTAKVSYIYPYLEGQTRTAKVRLEAHNPQLKLKPEMWANVVLEVESTETLAVPASAVIDTGTRNVAFVDKGDGHLEPRELKIGLRTDDQFEVLAGVTAGEKVVTRALFLVDSESQLRAAIAGMGAGGHQHDGAPRAEPAKTPPAETSSHQHTSPPAAVPQEAIASATDHYVKIQTALAADKLDGVRDAAEAISKLLPAPVADQAGAVAAANDIETARTRLKPLSVSLIQLLDRENFKTGRYLEAYCDMAKAPWLQAGRDVRNPYYGKGMLECGEIRKAR